MIEGNKPSFMVIDDPIGNVIKKPKYPCPFCKKEEATQLCDFVVGYAWTSRKDDKGRIIGGYPETCSNHMCKKCAYSLGIGGYDFCPVCVKLDEHIKRNHRDVRNRDLVSELLTPEEGEEE